MKKLLHFDHFPRNPIAALAVGFLWVTFPCAVMAQSFFDDPVKLPLEVIDTVPPWATPASLVDMDMDGDLDYVVSIPSSEGYELMYFENVGTRFEPEYEEADVTIFGIPDLDASPRFADIDGDRDADLYWVHNSGLGVHVFFLENKNQFGPAEFGDSPEIINPFNLDPQGMFVSFGDIDADGDNDAFMWNFGAGVQMYYQENTGSPGAPSFEDVEEGPYGLKPTELGAITTVIIDDWDCDGDMDVLMVGLYLPGWGGPGAPFYYWENTGSAEVPSFENYIKWTGHKGVDTYGDYDGDGDMDYIYEHYLYENIVGCGTVFDPADHSDFGIDALDVTGKSYFNPVLVNLDGHNALDLFICSAEDVEGGFDGGSIRYDYYRNIGSDECPDYQWIDSFPFGIPRTLVDSLNVHSVKFADLDNDGDLDLIGCNDYYLLEPLGLNADYYYLENTGNAFVPEFSVAEIVKNPFGLEYYIYPLYPHSLPIANTGSFVDIDGDGDLDHLTVKFGYQENIGTAESPEYSALQNLGLSSMPGDLRFYDCLSASDWDCDGDVDLIGTYGAYSAERHQKLFVVFNEGTEMEPAFERYKFYELDFVPGALHDLDGDGDIDALMARFPTDMIPQIDHIAYRNTAQSPTCVIKPDAVPSVVVDTTRVRTIRVNGLLSTWSATACHPPEFLWEFGDGAVHTGVVGEHQYLVNGTYDVCFTIEDVNGIDKECVEIKVSQTVGLQDFLESPDVLIYPNPASDYVFVKLNDDHSFDGIIEVFDMEGRLVYGKNTSLFGDGPGVEVPLNNLRPGLYTIRLTDNKIQYVGQIVKLSR